MITALGQSGNPQAVAAANAVVAAEQALISTAQASLQAQLAQTGGASPYLQVLRGASNAYVSALVANYTAQGEAPLSVQVQSNGSVVIALPPNAPLDTQVNTAQIQLSIATTAVVQLANSIEGAPTPAQQAQLNVLQANQAAAKQAVTQAQQTAAANQSAAAAADAASNAAVQTYLNAIQSATQAYQTMVASSSNGAATSSGVVITPTQPGGAPGQPFSITTIGNGH
jgi:hypothetical protein